MVRRVLLVGDGAVPTGFGRCNEHIAAGLKGAGFDVHWLAINYYGEPHPLQRDYKLYAPTVGRGDLLGVQRVRGIADALDPHLILLHGDAWVVAEYLRMLREGRTTNDPMPKIVAWVPPDSPNQPYGENLNGIDLLICPTQFGIDELRKGGYRWEATVVPYGYDPALFSPRDKTESRQALNMPEDAIIIGRADRNAKRKRYDDTFRLFKRFVEEPEWGGFLDKDRVFLHCHCAPTDVGWHLPQLAKYYGIQRRVMFTAKDLTPDQMIPSERMPTIYSAWDAHWSHTMGEGFGLVALESMACGVPQALPEYSAYGEWARGAAKLYRVGRQQATEGGINSMGALVDDDASLGALHEVLRDADTYRARALTRVRETRYHWPVVVENMLSHLNGILEG